LPGVPVDEGLYRLLNRSRILLKKSSLEVNAGSVFWYAIKQKEISVGSESSFSGPYIAAAFLCEKVLLEQGNVPTFVRVVDRFTIPKFSGPIPPGIQLPQQSVQVTLVVILKAGDLGAGNHRMAIRLQKPDHTYGPDNPPLSVFFQGSDDNGAMLSTQIMIAAPEEGLYWFDVSFEGSLLTRIPMRVIHQPAMLQVQMQAPPGEPN
jgi:hypothetical protein